MKICSNGGFSFIICEILAKDNLNIANLMQTFESLILQNCSTELYDIAHTHMALVWYHLDLGLCDQVCSSGYNNVKLYITIIVHYNV